jgi:hypothetical protein
MTGGAAGQPDAGMAMDAAGATGCEGILGHPTPPCSQIPTYPGVSLKMVEDFDSPLDLDTDSIWTYSDGFSDQSQVRLIKGAVTFAGGSALITMNRPPGGGPVGPSYAENENGGPYPRTAIPPTPGTSGELRTKYNNFKFGYYEFRMRPPVSTNGNFIAAAFTFRTPKWQDWRELDIELQAGTQIRTVPTNVIVAQNIGGYDARFASVQTAAVNFDTQAAFHTYGFDWEPTGVNFYIDRATNPNPVLVHPAGGTIPVPDKSGKIMMNLWMFGSAALGGGDPANNQYPMVMQIDYVRFYQSTREPFYPCAPTPACLNDATHREDLDFSKNNGTDGLPITTTGL